MLINISITTPIRKIGELSFEKRWHDTDKGVIISWECGREKAKTNPELAASALRNELPILGWKGGVDKPIKNGKKLGAIYYYAMWLGLRGDDLIIDTEQIYQLTCSKHGVTVTYTPNIKDLANT